MSQTDFIVQNDSTHPLVNKYDHRFMCTQAFEGSSSYVIRKNGSYYEAIKKYSSTGGGMIKYGGVSNLGGVTGTDFDAVLEAAATAIGYNGRIFLKAGVYATNGLNFKNTAAVTDATQQMLEIAGEGMGNTILKGNTTSTGASSTDGAFTEKAWIMVDSFDVTGIRIHIHDLTIDGQSGSNTNVVEGIVLRYGRNAIIERVFVHDVWRYGINIVGPNLGFHEVYVRNNIVYYVSNIANPANPIELNCAAIKSSFADLYLYHNVIGWVGYVGTVFTASSNGAGDGTTIINTAHTQADDYWNGHLIEVLTGTCAGETCRVSNFDAASDTLTLTGVGFSAQIDAGDTYQCGAVGCGIVMEDSDIAINNVIWACGDGIVTLGSSSSSQIIGNWIDFVYRSGIYLNTTRRTQVHDNVIRIPYDYAIYLQDSLQNSIQGNKISLQTGFSGNCFIAEIGTSDFNSILNNHLTLDGGTLKTYRVFTAATHTLIRDNFGFLTEGNFVSPTFDISSTGVKTVTIPHNLDVYVLRQYVQASVVEDTDVGDWAYGYVKIVSGDATEVVARVNVTVASATPAATAKLNIAIHNCYQSPGGSS
jgi:hypothetical protein